MRFEFILDGQKVRVSRLLHQTLGQVKSLKAPEKFWEHFVARQRIPYRPITREWQGLIPACMTVWKRSRSGSQTFRIPEGFSVNFRFTAEVLFLSVTPSGTNREIHLKVLETLFERTGLSGINVAELLEAE